MSFGLEALAKNLKENQFCEMKKIFTNPTKFKLMCRKGIFPYEYISDFDKLNDTSLPLKKDFYISLLKCNVSDEEFEHAKTVWKIFECKTLGEYSDIYLKTDVFLLTDIFENFR